MDNPLNLHDSIFVYFTLIPENINETDASSQVNTLPEHEQLTYHSRAKPLARLHFLCGRLLIMQIYSTLYPGQPCTIAHNTTGKPHLEGKAQIGISITHSGQMVVGALHTNGLVGVDAEAIRPINWEDFRAYFLPAEWNFILNHTDPLSAFFDLWTCKESVAKADGRGLELDFQNMDILSGRIVTGSNQWSFTRLILEDKFAAALAFMSAQQAPTSYIRRIDFHALLNRY